MALELSTWPLSICAIKEHFVKKSSEPENPREFWNAYRPFLHGKTKQANDIIITENNVVIRDKREIAELFVQCALYSNC